MPSSGSDLVFEAFFALQSEFFELDGSSRPFTLRPKHNTQDDPFDEYVASVLRGKLAGAKCERASGPLISPDMVIFREEDCNLANRDDLREDSSKIFGIEVKKLERTPSGQVSRASGMDYNTTPPCGTVRVYDRMDRGLDITGYYLFVCQEKCENGQVTLSALALCDGNLLNADFKLYLEITGKRKKGIGLGTYGDGMNRQRPMLVFSNPLGWSDLDRKCTLVSRRLNLAEGGRVKMVFEIGRTLAERAESDEGLDVLEEPTAKSGLFYAYRLAEHVPDGLEIVRYTDPFPRPLARSEATAQRGKFKVSIRPR